ncbi:TonB-dependent receptor [Paraglaciecola sp.]|uniref:TonB-dependent receptor n=1 Tax=Paraglaciecola sp. TaxID=1920173 RepID=UPI003EFB20E7
MKNTNNTIALGAQAVAAALIFNSGQVAAQEKAPKCEEDNTVECEANQTDQAIERIRIHGVQDSVYLFEKSGDLRRVADLVDTPQVITVLTQDQIQESGKTDLKDILAAQAGVTLGTGENGNAFGDRYIIRGHEARSDVFVDGLRDPGMTTRESFATERVEITKGPSSTFAGRGSSGGAVNSVTKTASTEYNFGRVDASVGSDEHTRLSVDYNLSLSDDAAIRLNALTAEQDKPGREGISRERDGLQVSAVYLPQDSLSFIADLYYLDAKDVPDLGSYFDQTTRAPLKNIPVYAQESDMLDSEVTTLTFRTKYEINEDFTFYNATRVGKTENAYITTGMRGGNRDATDPVAPSAATLSISTHQGWQDVDYLSTQFNLFWNTEGFGFKHKWVFGAEFSDESVDNGVFDITNNNPSNCLTSGRRGVTESYCLLDGNGIQVDNISQLMGRSYQRGITDAAYDIKTSSIYAMDTVALSKHLELFFGLRRDSFDLSNDTIGRSGEFLYDYSDQMYNGHIGLVYDFNQDTNVYVNYSTATNINGGESDLGASCGYGGLCGTPEQVLQSDPEKVENIELGTKWMLFDGKLLFSGSIFQITKSDVMESVGDSYSNLGTLNTGENRVKGIELGFTGNITDELSIQFSAASMNAEIINSFNEESIGLTLSNFADKSAYLQLRYQLSDKFVLGGDYSYQSEMYGGQPDTAAGYDSENARYSIVVPSYQVVNLFASYTLTEDLNLRLNVGNALDKEYWTAAYRSGSFMYLGDARNTRLTVNYQF